MLRLSTRRRLATLSGFLVAVMLFSTFSTKTNITVINQLQNDQKIEYNLPSLDEMMNSMLDLDFQRALLLFRNQYSQLPKDSPHLRVVVVSTWRSGSTFVGEILSSHPGVFYYYEPLLYKGFQQFSSRSKEQIEIGSLLRGLLQCDYSNADSFLQFNYGNPDSFVRNKRLWSICSSMPRFKCYKKEILSKLCSLFPIHVMKVVRARLSFLVPLLFSDPRTRIVFLTRDPRAVMSSRTSSVNWCSEQSCKDPNVLCSNMEEDLDSYLETSRLFSNRTFILRYEDLVRRPHNKTEEMFSFLGLSMRPQVTEYLNQHISGDENVPWSTVRNPKKQLTKWLKTSSWNFVVRTQYFCRPVMKRLGYRVFNSETDFNSENYLQHMNL